MALILVTFGLLATALARPAIASGPDDGPKAPTASPETRPDPVPIPIFLNAPADREAFWKMLGRPDLVVLDGELYRKLRQQAEAARAPDPTSPAVVESLTATGEVAGDRARVTVEYRVAMQADGPAWVSIHLDGLTLSEAREGARDLATRIAEGRGWELELRGKGEHLVRVGLLVPVTATAEGRRLDMPIPPAASTRIDLTVPRTVLDATTGIDEKVAILPVEGHTGTRLSARLSPRPKIELAWRERADPAAMLPALLSARGEIAIDIERGSIRSRSSWTVGAIRGSTNQLTLRFDPAEEILDLEVDSRPVQAEARRESGRSVVVIPLADPLRPTATRSVILTTRRPIASSGTARVVLQGYSFDQARVQTGMVAITRVGPLFLNPAPGRGLRRIDPRTELPDSLRTKADTVLAFEFNDQPFELALSVEPAPPRLRVESRTTVTLDPRSARLQTRLECRPSQGRIFEVQVVLPKGLEFEGAEPPEVVESARSVPLDPEDSATRGVDVPRILSIALTHQAREAESFTIVLQGWSAIDPSGPVALPLFRPIVDSNTGGRYAVVTDRNVSAELASAADEPSSFRLDVGSPPADWDWPARSPGLDQGLLWLRSDANPETMPLRAIVRPRSIRHESTFSVSIDRRGAEVVDEISGEVAFGTLSRLDVEIPREAADRWEVEGVERTIREPLAPEADGTRRYRLRFAREYTDTFLIRVRYRLPFAEPPTADRRGRLRLAPIRVLEGTSTGQRMVVSAESGIEVKVEAKGWSAGASGDLSASSEAGPPVRIALTRADEKAGPVFVDVRPGPQASLPGVVVSRLWIKTDQRPENDQVSTASFWVETRDGAMAIGLPPGSRPLRARVGSTELGEGGIEALAPDEYRLKFPPSTPPGPILVVVDYAVPASATSGGWPAPRLLGGGVVLQTIWEAQLPNSRAGVGTPSGWSDENEWSWDGLVWRRRPWKSDAELSNWLTGGSPRYRVANPPEAVDQAGRSRYLFSRAGPPTNLRFAVFSRLTLLLCCSGPLLLAGLLILSRRPPPRPMAASILLVAFAVGAMVERDVAILVLQSSALGIALFLSALGMHWAIDRRGRARPAGDRAVIVGPSTIGSSMSRIPGVGSDDSTAIRVRPITPSAISTTDHIVLSRAPGHPPDDLPVSGLDLR
jgi:hypothetical protein